jgi:hypothetical protein
MHKKGKVKRKRKNKFRTRQLRRQILFHKKMLRMEGEKGEENTQREEMLLLRSTEREHRARDGASLCNRCELKHF